MTQLVPFDVLSHIFESCTINRQDHLSFAQFLCLVIYSQLDCGIHPGRDGLDSLPFFDMIDPEQIDLLLVSQ